ncbi:hypothetical protein ECD97_04595, partial [Acinetobacter baumannii]|nr:hypothetical protein [Acinetobacter baumannii]
FTFNFYIKIYYYFHIFPFIFFLIFILFFLYFIIFTFNFYIKIYYYCYKCSLSCCQSIRACRKNDSKNRLKL